MEILQGRDIGRFDGHGKNSARCSNRGRERGDARHVVSHRRAANRFFIVEGFAAKGRIDDEVHFSCFHEIHDIGPAFIHLVNSFDRNASGSNRSRSAACGDQLQPSAPQILRKSRDMTLIVVVDAQKDDALPRQLLPRRQLRLRKRQPERRRNLLNGNTGDFTA